MYMDSLKLKAENFPKGNITFIDIEFIFMYLHICCFAKRGTNRTVYGEYSCLATEMVHLRITHTVEMNYEV